MAKFFRVPFGVSGNREAIPDNAPADGTVNYSTGYARDYERNPVTDPSAKMIERTHFNSILFDVTDAIRVLQSKGLPDFIYPDDNGGVAFPYQLGAVVSFAGKNYISRIANNTNLPTEATAWIELVPFDKSAESATAQEVNAGSGDKFVRSDFLRSGVRNTNLQGFSLTAGDIAAADNIVTGFGKTQKQINDLKTGTLKSISAGSSNVSIDNADPQNPKISVSGADIGSAPTKATIANGDGVVILDSADSNAIKRVAWSAIQAMLDAKFLPSKTNLGLTAKTALAAADQFLIADSADQNKAKGFTATRLYSAVHEANKGNYTEAGVAVPLTGATAMSGELQTPQVRLGGLATRDDHAPTFKQVKDTFLPITSPQTSGSLSVRRGALGIFNAADGAQNLINFAVDGENAYSSLYRDADKNLMFVMKNPETGASLRTPFRLNYAGGTVTHGDAEFNGIIKAPNGIQGSWVTLAANQPVNANDAATKRYVDEKTSSAVTVYTGDWEGETNFPLGHYIIAESNSLYLRQEQVWPRLGAQLQYLLFGSGTLLSGVWRCRGNSLISQGKWLVMAQKVGW